MEKQAAGLSVDCRERQIEESDINMELVIKHFNELSVKELFEILKLRVSVFVVEQKCPYQEVDDADLKACHIYLKDETGIIAYARVLPENTTFQEPSIGRVIAVKRRCGLGIQIVSAGIQVAREEFGAKCIVIEAQVYARKLYENLGFVQSSPEYLEDGIPHIKMTLQL